MIWPALLLSMLCSFFSYAALEKNTLVYTPEGLVSVATLLPNDVVTSQFNELSVIQNKKQYVEELFVLELEKESIYISGDQLFYDFQSKKWIRAENLSVNNILQDINNKGVQCIRIDRSKNIVEMYDLSLTNPHTFFVGKTGLLTHNLVIAALPVAVPAIITIGKIGTLIAGVIGLLLKHNNEYKQKNSAYVQDHTISMNPGGPEDDDQKKHLYGKYQDASYHHKNNSGNKSMAPKNGQKALDNSVLVSCDSSRRVAVSDGEIVILDQTKSGLYHGHVRTWIELKEAGTAGQKIINALIKNNLVNSRGKFLC